jgi:hypothetical protein
MTNLLRRVISEVLSDSIDYHVAPTFARPVNEATGRNPREKSVAIQ